MNTRLNYTQNWSELAREANWSASVLAKKCDVSSQTLYRHFLKQMGNSPKKWMAVQRQLQAIELLREGLSVKEAAMCLGYKHANQFSREFKRFSGFAPSSNISHNPLQR